MKNCYVREIAFHIWSVGCQAHTKKPLKRLFCGWKKSLAVVFILVSSGTAASAQDELDQAFDHQPVSSLQNVVKVNLGNILSSDIELQYERRLSDVFSIQIGYGLALGGGLVDVYNPYSYSLFDDKPTKLSRSILTIGPRVYFAERAPLSVYVSPIYSRITTSYDNSHTISDRYLISPGFQTELTSDLMVDFNIGVGYMQSSREFTSEAETRIGGFFLFPDALEENKVALQVQLAVGYAF